jgi:hypothetical protein
MITPNTTKQGHFFAINSERIDDDLTMFQGKVFASMNLLHLNDSTMISLCEPNGHLLGYCTWRNPIVKAERQGNNYQVDWTSKQEKGYIAWRIWKSMAGSAGTTNWMQFICLWEGKKLKFSQVTSM